MAAGLSYDIDDIFLHARLHPHLFNFETAALNRCRIRQRLKLHTFQMMRIEPRIPTATIPAHLPAKVINYNFQQKAVERAPARISASYSIGFPSPAPEHWGQRMALTVDRCLPLLIASSRQPEFSAGAVYFVGKKIS